MAEYHNLQSLLDAALGEYLTKGFSLTEDRDHLLYLSHQGKKIATFTQYVSIPLLHGYCREYLRKVSGEQARRNTERLALKIIMEDTTNWPVSLARFTKGMEN